MTDTTPPYDRATLWGVVADVLRAIETRDWERLEAAGMAIVADARRKQALGATVAGPEAEDRPEVQADGV